MNGNLIINESIETLYSNLLELWRQLADEAVSAHGKFFVALAGGSTPKAFYTRLAEAGQSLPWRNTCIYFGDERCVPQDHADSNFNMARHALLDRVPIPEDQLHPMYDPTISPEQNASHYAQQLAQQLPQNDQGRPIFDLILLGMGNDGHTASLFPDTSLLQETHANVGAQYVDKLQAWRISLTYPTINAARHVVLLVAGAGKADMLKTIANTPAGEIRFPVQAVNPLGQLDWYLDTAAATQLPVNTL